MDASTATEPTARATVDVAAPAERAWRLITDLTADRDGENYAAGWVRAVQPDVGSRFRGWNRNGLRRWRTTATVTRWQPGRTFAFRVTSLGLTVADWRYDLEPTAAGCRITESTWDRRGRILGVLGPLVTGVRDRADRNQQGIEETLAVLKATLDKA